MSSELWKARYIEYSQTILIIIKTNQFLDGQSFLYVFLSLFLLKHALGSPKEAPRSRKLPRSPQEDPRKLPGRPQVKEK